MKLRWHGLEGRIYPLSGRAVRVSPVSQLPVPVMKAQCGAALGRPQKCRLTAFESYASMTCSPSSRWRDAAAVLEGLDYGGPAVIEPRLLRPEILRHHLSVGLPFANPKALPEVFIGRPYN